MLFAYRINHLPLQLTFKQRPMPVGGRGQDSGSKGTQILNQHPASPLQKRRERKKMLCASQLLQQAFCEKWVKSRLDRL
jgi:hypothetical protein